jgi:hypothetical protein
MCIFYKLRIENRIDMLSMRDRMPICINSALNEGEGAN